mmetsp:Transcript_15373/g.22832  ORF Transcript_15373/g.22832 Transcript_15373/m.22832 type:complete len:80 (+) Transcript_15373:249-488(+)
MTERKGINLPIGRSTRILQRTKEDWVPTLVTTVVMGMVMGKNIFRNIGDIIMDIHMEVSMEENIIGMDQKTNFSAFIEY